MTINEIIETLKIAKAEVEWNYPLDYAIAIDEAINILMEVDGEDDNNNRNNDGHNVRSDRHSNSPKA